MVARMRGHGIKMKIKKFKCINCGAPKVNPYKSPYIVCDYCGSFTDIDFTLGMNYWNQSPITNIGYAFNKMEFARKIQAAMQRQDEKAYWQLQHDYWDYYYKTYPPYLPPSIDTPEKYAMYLKVCADSSLKSATSQEISNKQMALKNIQNFLTYHNEGGKTIVDSKIFFQMADIFISFTKESFANFYNDPNFSIMEELLPSGVHLKMKLSQFVQVWLPYLTEDDQVKFLKMAGFTSEYVEIEQPPGHAGNCEHCKAELYIPEGSYRVFCESCRKSTKVQSQFKCSSCGAEVEVPDNPAKPIECPYCGVENRLIKAMFG